MKRKGQRTRKAEGAQTEARHENVVKRKSKVVPASFREKEMLCHRRRRSETERDRERTDKLSVSEKKNEEIRWLGVF